MADEVRTLLIKVTVDASKAKDGLDGVGKGADVAGVKTVALGGIVANMAGKLLDMGLAAAKAGAAFLQDLVFGTAAAGDEIAKAAKQLDVATDGLQRLRGATQLSGADAKDLGKGLTTLRKGLAEAVEGTGPAADALELLGLKVEDVDSFLAQGDIEGAVGVIGDAFNATGDSAQKSAALLDLFGGKAGRELLPLLTSGSEGIRAMGDEISATGSVISGQALGDFEDMQDSLLELELQADGLKVGIASALGPAVTEAAGLFREWIAENDTFIRQELPVILREVADEMIGVAKVTLEWLDSARELSRDVVRLTEDYDAWADSNKELATAMDTVLSPLDAMTEGIDALATAGSGAVDWALEQAEALLRLAGASDETLASLKALVGATDATAGQKVTAGSRAAAAITGVDSGKSAFLGGGQSTAGPTTFDRAASSGDTSELDRIAGSSSFSDSSRADARAASEAITASKAAEVTDRESKAAADRAASIQDSRARNEAARPARKPKAARRGGGKKAKAEPTLDELVGASVGGAGASALRSAASAVSGTVLITNITNINGGDVNVGGVTVSAVLPVDVGPETAEAIKVIAGGELARQNQALVQSIEARNKVGL